MKYEDFKDFLPKRIFDAHVHFIRRESWPAECKPKETDYKLKFGWHFGFPEYRQWAAEFLPGHELYVNAFGSPDKTVDRADADAFTGSFVDGVKCFGMALASPADSPEELEARMRKNHLCGLKPYGNLVPTAKPSADIELDELLTPAQLEMANHYGWAITVHIPRLERLADVTNLRHMEEWVKAYPNVKFIFAHIGRAYFLNCVKGRLERFADYGNCYFDTAMVNNDRVLEYAFRHFPLSRLVFGTDSPIAMLPGKSLEINDQYVYMMGLPSCSIGTSLDGSPSGLKFVSFYYEQLNGIMVAAESAGLTSDEINAFFFGNANKLLREASTWLA